MEKKISKNLNGEKLKNKKVWRREREASLRCPTGGRISAAAVAHSYVAAEVLLPFAVHCAPPRGISHRPSFSPCKPSRGADDENQFPLLRLARSVALESRASRRSTDISRGVIRTPVPFMHSCCSRRVRALACARSRPPSAAPTSTRKSR